MGVKVIDTSMGSLAEASKLELANPGDSGGRIQALQYPLSLKGAEPRHSSYLMFYAVEPTTGGMTDNKLDNRTMKAVSGDYKEETKAVIQMYMPNMMENLTFNYDATEADFLQDLIVNIGSALGQSGPELTDQMKAGGEAGIKTLVNQVGVNIGKVTKTYNAQVSGQVLGSRAAHMYSSTGVRQQNFLFQLRPRSLAELREVGQILRTFLMLSSAKEGKRASMSQVMGDIGISSIASAVKWSTDVDEGFNVLGVPCMWYIEERVNQMNSEGHARYTPKFAMGPCAITNIRINKSPDQTYDTFAGTAGDPIAIDLEFTATELRPVHRGFWDAITKNLGDPDSGEFFFGSYGSKK